MSILFSVIVFLIILFVLVLVHEWGHYIVAKLTRMRVDEFGIGFPPTLWSKQVGETKYALNALPIGGYVKIWGENGEENSQVLKPEDQARTFTARPKYAQALVLIAGVTMNMLLAWVLLVILAITLIGGVKPIAEIDYNSASRLLVADVLAGSPATDNIPTGAEIVAVKLLADDNSALTELTPTNFTKLVAQAGEETIALTYKYEEQINTVNLQPALITTDGVERALLGVALSLVTPVDYGWLGAIKAGTLTMIDLTKNIIGGIFNFFNDIFAGRADFSTVAGPVGIVGYVGTATENGLSALLFFTALISINLAVINLLPIPALDGGRLVLVVIEAIIRRPLPPVLAGRVNIIGFLFLIGVMVMVTVSDIWKLF